MAQANQPAANAVGSGPHSPAGQFGAGSEAAAEAPDHVPAVASADLDVALLVDPHEAGVGETRLP